jgi:hypothetical protein
MVPGAGIEPARRCQRGILNPTGGPMKSIIYIYFNGLRLPVTTNSPYLLPSLSPLCRHFS